MAIGSLFSRSGGTPSSPAQTPDSSTQQTQPAADPQNQQVQQDQQSLKDDQQLPDELSKFWNDEQTDPQKPTDSATQPQKPADTVDFNKQLNEFITSKNLFQGIDPAKMATELQEGKLDHLNETIGGAINRAFQEMLTIQAKFHNSAVDTAVQKALRESTNYSRLDAAKSRLNEALPFTTEEAFSPIADSILNQAMKIHKNDHTKAVKTTVQFFRAMQKQFSSGFKQRQLKDPQFSEMFQLNPDETEDLTPSHNAPNIDFMKLLKGS